MSSSDPTDTKQNSLSSSQISNTSSEEKTENEGEWTKLDISNMKLIALSPNIAFYTNITELLLQNNNLTSLPNEIFLLRQLQVLDLSRNRITRIQPEICNLLQLRDLNLNRNDIRELPVTMGKLFRLQKLSINDNPLSQIYLEVLQKGTQYCISYLRDSMQYVDKHVEREWAINKKTNHSIQPGCVRVMNYNVLADSYAVNERINYCPSWALKWEYRKQYILKEILECAAHIICLQEVETEHYANFFQPELARAGYAGRFCSKSRARTMDESSKKTVDGCAIFWKRELFDCIEEEAIEFQAIALRKHDTIGSGIDRLMNKDNIAITVLLKPKGSLKIYPYAETDQILVANTHIYWEPTCSDVKLMQVQMMIEKLEEIVARRGKTRDGRIDHSMIPTIICGDFNASPNSSVCQLLSTGRVEGDHAEFCQQDYGVYTQKGLEHSFSLTSAYVAVTGSEPAFTNYTGDYVGVLDYIWFTEATLYPEKVLIPISEEVILSHCGALPNPFWGSDHVPLVCDFYGKIPQQLSQNKKKLHFVNK